MENDEPMLETSIAAPKRQALIINNMKIIEKAYLAILVGIGIFAFSNFIGNCAFGTKTIEAAVLGASILLSSLAGFFAVVLSDFIPRKRLIGKIAETLEEKDYEVETIKQADFPKISTALDRMAGNSAQNSKTLFLILGHGYMAGDESHIVMSDGYLFSSVEMARRLEEINGEKVVLIHSCKAGGFTKSVDGTKGSSNAIVVTSSDRKNTGRNAMLRMMYGIAKKKSCEPFVNQVREFNSGHRKWLSTYRPRVYCGKMMEKFRL